MRMRTGTRESASLFRTRVRLSACTPRLFVNARVFFLLVYRQVCTVRVTLYIYIGIYRVIRYYIKGNSTRNRASRANSRSFRQRRTVYLSVYPQEDYGNLFLVIFVACERRTREKYRKCVRGAVYAPGSRAFLPYSISQSAALVSVVREILRAHRIRVSACTGAATRTHVRTYACTHARTLVRVLRARSLCAARACMSDANGTADDYPSRVIT